MKFYRGYTPRIEYDASIKMYSGRILGIRDVITFEGSDVDETVKAFHEAVDDYLAWCESDA